MMVTDDSTQYDQLVSTLDILIDEVGEGESHPLRSLMDEISAVIESYENVHVSELF